MTIRFAAWVGAACLVAALPVAVSPRWGWAASAAVAAAAAAQAGRHLRSRWAAPLQQVADAARTPLGLPHAPADQVARLVAFEFRDALQRLAEVAAHARRQEAALDHAADGVLLIDGRGLVEYANAAARALCGGRALELTRRLAHPELAELVRRARERGAPTADELTIRTPAPRRVAARCVPLASAGCVLLLSDLSEAERLDRVRRDFVANVSHELKTPAAAIRALADVAAAAVADGDAAAVSRFVERLQAEADRLAGLVADLLDLSRVEAGLSTDLQPTDLLAVAEAAADRVRPLAELKGIALEVSGRRAVVPADPAQVAMAVHNLVDNAVRYSERGTVRVTVEERAGQVAVVVADEGIGIPAEELPRIFERFYRVDRARSRATGGTGLGLSIVRHVALNHGGRVDVRSELGAGSTFTLLLPAASANAA